MEPSAHIITDGWLSFETPPANTHEAKVRRQREGTQDPPLGPLRVLQPEIMAKGGFYGHKKRHLQRYLDKFVFRWKRLQHMRSALDTLLGIGVSLGPATYRDFVELRA